MGTVGPHLGVPPEVTEAFPSGRFRSFSDVEVGGVPKDAERLRPAPSWNVSEPSVWLGAEVGHVTHALVLVFAVGPGSIRQRVRLDPG